MLRDRGEGCGVLVSKFPKDTDASYYLQDPSEACPHTHEYFAVNGFLHVLTLLKTNSIGDEFLATIGGVETNAARCVKRMYNK